MVWVIVGFSIRFSVWFVGGYAHVFVFRWYSTAPRQRGGGTIIQSLVTRAYFVFSYFFVSAACNELELVKRYLQCTSKMKKWHRTIVLEELLKAVQRTCVGRLSYCIKMFVISERLLNLFAIFNVWYFKQWENFIPYCFAFEFKIHSKTFSVGLCFMRATSNEFRYNIFLLCLLIIFIIVH